MDQRITRDVERLVADLAALVPSMVKPVVDILWFSSQLWALTGRRGAAVLYIYAALGFGCLRCDALPEPALYKHPIYDYIYDTRAVCQVSGIWLFCRAVTPDFGVLANAQYGLEGAFRNVHTRLRTHAESVAFFGGGAREGASVAATFDALMLHLRKMSDVRWAHAVADEFFTKQLPNNVTWLLTLMYSLEQKGTSQMHVALV